MKIIGIDFSKNDKKCGIAMADFQDGRGKITLLGLRTNQTVEMIVRTIQSENGIMAIDAPLGWPEEMGSSLQNHSAGNFVATPANSMFRRKTDETIKEVTGKQSLDVGADKIARTAHGALMLINDFRKSTSKKLPLAWDPYKIEEFSVVEVYPAATLKQHGYRYEGYKDTGKENIRREMIQEISEIIEMTEAQKNMAIENDNILDSVVCIIAALDFLKGDVIPPVEKNLAYKEGWIWVKARGNI